MKKSLIIIFIIILAVHIAVLMFFLMKKDSGGTDNSIPDASELPDPVLVPEPRIKKDPAGMRTLTQERVPLISKIRFRALLRNFRRFLRSMPVFWWIPLQERF